MSIACGRKFWVKKLYRTGQKAVFKQTIVRMRVCRTSPSWRALFSSFSLLIQHISMAHVSSTLYNQELYPKTKQR